MLPKKKSVFTQEVKTAEEMPRSKDQKGTSAEKEGQVPQKRRAKVPKGDANVMEAATHLHLQRKDISKLDGVKSWRYVQYLFLQENLLKRIGHLHHMRHLKELYLHDNKIQRVEGLRRLHRLKKLFLPRNRIEVLEGLPPNLEVLDIREQRLPESSCLLLDPHALRVVQNSLRIFDISGNGICDLGPVAILGKLSVLRAVDNKVEDLRKLTSALKQLVVLDDLDLRGNPVTTDRSYAATLLREAPPSLRVFDQRDVDSNQRLLLRKLNESRERLSKRKPKPTEGRIPAQQSEAEANAHFFFEGKPVQEAGESAKESRYILGALRSSQFEEYLSRQRVTSLEDPAAIVNDVHPSTEDCQDSQLNSSS